MEIGEPSSSHVVVIDEENEITVENLVEIDKACEITIEQETEPQESHLSPELQSELYKHTVAGDWRSIKSLLDDNPEAIRSQVTHNSGTVLHLAIATNKETSFWRNLLACTPCDVLRMRTDEGDTTLHHAASFGNLEAAKLLVEKDPRLLYLWNHNLCLPLHEAVKSANREMISYLLDLTGDDVEELVPSPFNGYPGIMLVKNLILHGFCDLALRLVQKYTRLATRPESLDSIACPRSNFRSNFFRRRHFKWEAILYNAATIVSRLISGRSETSSGCAAIFTSVAIWCVLFPPLGIMLFLESPYLTSFVRRMESDKKLHNYSNEFVSFVCKELTKIDPNEAKVIFQNAAKEAARNGIHEIIEHIMKACPAALFLENDDPSISIFHIAVKYRQHTVFNLLFQMSSQRDALLARMDQDGNTILHIGATLPPPDRLNRAYGAALQMQSEVLWYMAVLKVVPPWVKEAPNHHGTKPWTMFLEEHKDLVKKGEKWINGTARSCTLIAALISTVACAASINVPGGSNNNTGLPLFSKRIGFSVFAMSNTISLFFSIISLLIFLGLLTNSYQAGNFMDFLPRSLLWALITLHISIYFLIITFGVRIHLVYSQMGVWILLLLIFLGSYTTLVVFGRQFLLLLEIISSTMGNKISGVGIFYKQGNDLLM